MVFVEVSEQQEVVLTLEYDNGVIYCEDVVNLTVVKVETLEWEQADPGNAPLDDCTNNGGKRIFPGKTGPQSDQPALRRNVKLVATLAPSGLDIPVTVHFRVWDVDDPFDQLHGPNGPVADLIADVSLIDSNMAGPDNRGEDDQGPGVYAANTNAEEPDKAIVTLTVAMQPGDNYRAGASCLSDAVSTDQVTQADADLLGVKTDPNGWFIPNGNFNEYRVPVTWSPMLTVWRILHVETDSMARPTFAQNTWTMSWNEPRQGSVPTQVVFDVDDPPTDGADTDSDQFTHGYVQLTTAGGDPLVTTRVVGYVTEGFPTEDADDDVCTINITDCGDGHSGLECLQGVTNGDAIFSDDDLSVEATFTTKVWGCDDVFAGGGNALLPPDLSALQLRYNPAYTEPVHEINVSGTGGVAIFLRNQGFGWLADFGKNLWDQVTLVRGLPVSTSDYWTVMLVSAWQAEEAEDMDPDSEAMTGNGVTFGINTHPDGSTQALAALGQAYTGIGAVFRAVASEAAGREQFTVAHEVGHTLGLPHNPVAQDDPPMGLMDPKGDGQLLPFTGQSLTRLRGYQEP